MCAKIRHDRKSQFPPSVTVNCDMDPGYANDGFWGYEYEGMDADEAAPKTKEEALDEPVESWGWINNVD